MELNARSKQIRRDIYALSKANGGYHYGGSFSCVEILIALFDFIMTDLDRFILSKGHACWGLYVLLREKGLDPLLEGHPKLDLHNGIAWTTGSMGHGLPAAIGMAMARRMQGIPGKVYVIMGDGECQEGTTWESLLIGGKHILDNLVVIVDGNGLQACNFIDSILPLNALIPAAKAAGWAVDRVDGHNISELVRIIRLDPMWISKRPRLIIADTVKGAGVSFMEGQSAWHSNWPNADQEKQLLEELQ